MSAFSSQWVRFHFMCTQRYREASDIIKKGKLCSLFINDLDAGAAPRRRALPFPRFDCARETLGTASFSLTAATSHSQPKTTIGTSRKVVILLFLSCPHPGPIVMFSLASSWSGGRQYDEHCCIRDLSRDLSSPARRRPGCATAPSTTRDLIDLQPPSQLTSNLIRRDPSLTQSIRHAGAGPDGRRHAVYCEQPDGECDADEYRRQPDQRTAAGRVQDGGDPPRAHHLHRRAPRWLACRTTQRLQHYNRTSCVVAGSKPSSV